eukprot:RCo031128
MGERVEELKKRMPMLSGRVLRWAPVVSASVSPFSPLTCSSLLPFLPLSAVCCFLVLCCKCSHDCFACSAEYGNRICEAGSRGRECYRSEKLSDGCTLCLLLMFVQLSCKKK